MKSKWSRAFEISDNINDIENLTRKAVSGIWYELIKHGWFYTYMLLTFQSCLISTIHIWYSLINIISLLNFNPNNMALDIVIQIDEFIFNKANITLWWWNAHAWGTVYRGTHVLMFVYAWCNYFLYALVTWVTFLGKVWSP